MAKSVVRNPLGASPNRFVNKCTPSLNTLFARIPAVNRTPSVQSQLLNRRMYHVFTTCVSIA